MNSTRIHRKSQNREFFAHHMLLHAAELQILEAEASESGRFNKFLAAMVMTALDIEAIANSSDKQQFTRLPHPKLALIATTSILGVRP